MDELVIHPKKIDEFIQLTKNPELKILIIQGPSGCGKNTLIETFWNDNSLIAKRCKDVKLLQQDDDLVFRKVKESDDFISMMNFLSENYRSRPSNLRNGKKKISRFWKDFNKKMRVSLKNSQRNGNINQTHNNGNSQRNRNGSIHKLQSKVLVFNGVPEWLKVYSIKKFEMLKEFQDRLSMIINHEKTNLIIFTFSDSKECWKSFLSKIFGEILSK